MSEKDRDKERAGTATGSGADEPEAGHGSVAARAAEEQLKALNDTLFYILQETSALEGAEFFALLLARLSETLGFKYAMVSEIVDAGKSTAETLFFYANGRVVDNIVYELAGTPCSKVVETGLCIYPERVSAVFPEDKTLVNMGIESYIGIPLLDSKGEVLGLLNAFTDEPVKNVEFCRAVFTVVAIRAGAELERLGLQSELRKVTELLEAIMDNSPAAIFIKDSEGRLLFVNRWLGAQPGFKGRQVEGLTDYDIMPKDVADTFRQNDMLTLESGCAQTFEEVLRLPDGSEQTFIAVKFPLPSLPGSICGIATDITERKRLEGALVRAGKLESIGRLAGGIAHDFNNVLLGVLGNASIAKTLVGPGHKVWPFLDDIEKAANRAKIVTRQLLTFSRGDVMIKELVAPETLVYNRSKLLLNRHDVGLNANLGDGVWSVEVDEVMIGQVVEHIMLNAVHSMPEGGTVELRVGNVTLADKELPPLEAGRYVKIDFKDHGTGIEEEVLPLLFDPFFTTKECASGLGLAVSYSIVRKHGGAITVESVMGEGALFSLYLPATEVVNEQQTRGEGIVRQEGKVLVMDDEEIIRDVTGEMLKLIGFEVDFALDGKEAIGLYKNAFAAGAAYKAVIMDLTIPNGMGGKEAILELVKFDPDVRAVVSSGYSRDPVMASFKEFGFSAVLVKPYKFDEFCRVVQSVVAKG